MKKAVRVLYLSNAERYFQYTAAFRASVKALPFDDRSVVLRTMGLGSDKTVDPYFYVVQPGRNFQAWLEEPKVYGVSHFNKRLEPLEKRFLYAIKASPGDPPPSPPAQASKK